MLYVLFDDDASRNNLLPLTFTRPVSEIRIGILTIRQKWDLALNTSCQWQTQKYLQKKFPAAGASNAIYINGCICPDDLLVKEILKLEAGSGLVKNGLLLAFNGSLELIDNRSKIKLTEYNENVLSVEQPWHIFQKNHTAIKLDFDCLTKNRKSESLNSSVTVIGDASQIFLEKGAKAHACILNASTGPIYLASDSEIMEGSVVRGPLALCEHSVLKLSTKIYGATTIGPHSKVGGEVNNSVIFGYSNKAHDGFLGNSVIAEWCNLGADTNNSNLKNNYGNVKLYNYGLKKQMDSGLQFCGLIMADHSKSGINTMFNTGTVVGVACNIFGGGFPPTHIPDFSWGGSEGFTTYQTEKLFETAGKMYERRGLIFDQTEKDILNNLFDNRMV